MAISYHARQCSPLILVAALLLTSCVSRDTSYRHREASPAPKVSMKDSVQTNMAVARPTKRRRRVKIIRLIAGPPLPVRHARSAGAWLKLTEDQKLSRALAVVRREAPGAELTRFARDVITCMNVSLRSKMPFKPEAEKATQDLDAALTGCVLLVEIWREEQGDKL